MTPSAWLAALDAPGWLPDALCFGLALLVVVGVLGAEYGWDRPGHAPTTATPAPPRRLP